MQFHVTSLVRCSIESVLFGSFAGSEEGIITEEMESTETQGRGRFNGERFRRLGRFEFMLIE